MNPKTWTPRQQIERGIAAAALLLVLIWPATGFSSYWSHTILLETFIFGIELAPGDMPRAVEQVNGDLLVPSAGRARLEKALLMAEEALPAECRAELQALVEARRLLGVKKPDREKERMHGQLLKVAAI